MRFSRVVIGVLVICAALWVIVSEQMAGASADAVLNAQVVEVRTPIAGDLRDADRALGSAVGEGDTLATIVDPNPDSVRLDDLILQRDQMLIRIQDIESRQAALQAEAAVLLTRSDSYQELSIKELHARLDEANVRLRIRASGSQVSDAIALSLAREEVARLKIILEGAELGVFIVGGYNDAPYSEQRGDEIRHDLAYLQTDLQTATDELAAIKRRIDQEQIRVGRMGVASIKAPVSGVIWENRAVTGSHVERGDTVVRLADCSSAFITLSVTQTVYNRLQPGSTATFRFDGSGEVFTGTVSRLAGTSATAVYDSLAIAPSPRHLERADVLLVLPELANHPELRCAIGRTGRAFFEVRPLDWLRGYF